MQVVSVNVGQIRDYDYRGQQFRSAIYKEAVPGRVALHREQVDGDDQADRRVHGGADMAVYAYPFEHYAFWQSETGREAFPYGQFGENLTLTGLPEEAVRVGDVLRVGSAVLQVSEPRIPCFKLVMRMDAGANFAARFLKSGRLGYYLRVLKEGDIGAGDDVSFILPATDSPTMAEFIRISQFETHNLGALRRIQAARGLSMKWRDALQKHIDRGVES